MLDVWDLYDENMNNTGKKINENEKIPDGFYHLSAEIWIFNKNKEVLLLKSNYDYSKLYPGMWKCLTGNLKSEEGIFDCLNRVLKEKIGLEIDKNKIIVLGPHKRSKYNYAYFTCIINDNIDVCNLNIDSNVYTDCLFVDKKQLTKMCDNGEIAYYLIDRINNEIIDKM